MRFSLLLALAVVASGPSLAQAPSGLTGTGTAPGGLSGDTTAPSSAAPANPASPATRGAATSARPGVTTPPIASPGNEGSSGRPVVPGTTQAPPSSGNARLDAQSLKLDRQIRRGICTGC
jgi:hypothetical protein